MVTIINGEIVQDNDPRAQAYKQRNRRPESSNEQGGRVDQSSFSTRQRPNGPSVLGQGSMLDQVNNKLLEAGFPRWNLGQNVVEPIVSVILILALLLFGFKGLLIVGFIWFMLRQSAGQQ